MNRRSRGQDEKGRLRIRPFRLYQAWIWRSVSESFFLANRLNVGLPVLGATINENELADGRFFYYSADVQYLRRFESDFSLILKGKLQLSPEPLPSAEQFRLSSYSRAVRGFPESFYISDSGVYFSAEMRFPILKIQEWNTLIQIAPFVDLATGWNADDFQIEPSTIASTGLGLIWQTSERFSAGIYWAYPLVHIEREKNTLQEQGLIFFIKWRALSW